MKIDLENLDLTTTHCVFFIYYTFASYNNGKTQTTEVKKIMSYMENWDTSSSHVNSIMKETVLWASHIIKSPEEAISTMFSMADYLNTLENFDISKKEQLLLDIRSVSRIDGVFSEKEKKWHDLLAHHLSTNIRVSSCSTQDLETGLKKIERRKIGFVR
tara:strand:+ start:824 stop:1300 length:477 start_codon:yes stop_codon:yes gene_type:complete